MYPNMRIKFIMSVNYKIQIWRQQFSYEECKWVLNVPATGMLLRKYYSRSIIQLK